MTEWESFAAWLKQRRRERRLTQAQPVAQAGLSRTYVVKRESENVLLPQSRTRDKLHAVLGTDDDEVQELGLVNWDYTGYEYSPIADAAATHQRQEEEQIRAVRERLQKKRGSSADSTRWADDLARLAVTTEERYRMVYAFLTALIELDIEEVL